MGNTGSLFEGFAGMIGNNIEWVGNLIGYLVAEGKRAEARKIYETMLADLADEQVPAFKELVAEQIGPEQEVLADPTAREAQYRALRQMQVMAEEGGMDAGSRLAVQQARQSADSQASGERQAALMQAQRTGGLGSGQMLAAQLGAGQAASNRANTQSMQAAADARSRALQAIGQSGQLGSQIRGDQFSEDDANRQARMAREQFNAKMRMTAANANNDLLQQEYNNRMAKLRAINQARGRIARDIEESAEEQQAAARKQSGDWNKKGKYAGRAIGNAYDAYSGGGM